MTLEQTHTDTRIDLQNSEHAGVMRAMFGLEQALRDSGLEFKLRELVKMRASQINGCAYCIDMHSKDARAGGETEGRLYALSAWRETPFFTERERAALEWTEELTLLSTCQVGDDLYARVRRHFSEAELVKLTLAVIQINGWNRIAKTFRAPVGTYHPGQHANA